MDPITILAAATAAYNGVKKAVELGREVQDVYGQLSTWAGHMGDLKDAIEGIEKEEARPSIFKKITFDKSETAEAFDMYAAKQKMKEMEEEIMHMFLYGDLCHLGLDGYREFKRMRNEIHEKRKRLIENQIAAKKAFIHNIRDGSLILFTMLIGGSLLWVMISFVYDHIK